MPDNLQHALNELHLTMGKMESALGLIDEAIAWINIKGEIEWCNGVFDRLTDRSHIELISQPLVDLLPLEESGTRVPIHSHPAILVLKKNEIQRGYYQLTTKGLPIELVAVPLHLPHQPGGAILTLRDISELRELEQVRLQSLALQAAADAIVITDSRGYIQWVNRAFSTLTGYTADIAYGQRMKILQSGKTPDSTYKAMWSKIQTGQVWHGELINKRKDGHIYFEEQSITPVRDSTGAISHYIAIKRDISDRKAAESEIQKLSSVATRTDNSVIITDENGKIEWVNTAFTRMTEYTLQDVVGRSPGSFLQGPETDALTIEKMSKAIKANNGFDVEIVNYSKTDRKYWLSIEVRPLYGEHGQIINFLAIENDITERKQAEEQLVEARRREIDIAARIQKTLLLGRTREQINGVQLAAMSVPSQQVDGDFFDCFVHSEECMDVVLGDVMGKGVPAALLGGATKSAILRSMNSIMSSSSDHHLPHPREIIMSLHAGVACELIALNSFVTLFYARICNKRKVIQFVDCGHTQSIICSKNEDSCRFFSGTNMPLGFSARETYQEIELPLNPEDVIVLYSDGITEAVNDEGLMFGEDQLLDVVRSHRHLKCDEILAKIHQSVCDFSADRSFGDDLTCLVIKMDKHHENPVLGQASFSHPVALTSLRTLRQELSHFFSAHYDKTCFKDTLDQLLTGVNEAATNIIQHAFSEPTDQDVIHMILSASSGELKIELCHNGAAFSATSSILPNPAGDTESGYGLYIMEQCFDSIHYSRRPDGLNRLLLRKKITPQESSANES